MATCNVLLVIADIGGYTKFIRAHRTSLAHADLIVHELLESVVRAGAGRLKLSKLEGDAVFLFADAEVTSDELTALLGQMHRSFHATQQMIEKNQICGCTACIGAGGLRLKVVAHYGHAMIRTIRRAHELTGECVIIAHRMLKNNVPIPEYALFSEEVARTTKAEMRCRLVPSQLTMEGFGEVSASYLDLRALAGEIPPPTKAPWLMRFMAYAWHGVLVIPYRLGLKKPLEEFRNIPV